MATTDERSFGVFKPVGHVVISFASAQQADATADALRSAGFSSDALRRLTDREMLAHIEQDLQRASPLAAVGQELNLIKAQQALAQRGYHWLIVHAPHDADARRAGDIAREHGAERAQRYGAFIIEELIEHSTDKAHVAESPDRGLDAETPSGDESERARLRPARR
jgi:hypothetical protein